MQRRLRRTCCKSLISAVVELYSFQVQVTKVDRQVPPVGWYQKLKSNGLCWVDPPPSYDAPPDTSREEEEEEEEDDDDDDDP